ncbi:hypothetical protein SCOCK_60174 [Actinacidiphila cocklensis]|uniref:Uncharacterized protein n=1 Tax=Actinacidiphila cocklensis TaxID=887465 RepID=A0A9W4GUS8_9ACTN|nr:hypothetical protein SCOCK_60174 [Actinacidiphila cocklensis]
MARGVHRVLPGRMNLRLPAAQTSTDRRPATGLRSRDVLEAV